MSFEIFQRSTYQDHYHVEAETEEEAKTLVLEGKADLVESEFIEADLDSNTLQAVRSDSSAQPSKL